MSLALRVAERRNEQASKAYQVLSLLSKMNFGRAVWPPRIHSVIRCLRQNASGFAATAHPCRVLACTLRLEARTSPVRRCLINWPYFQLPGDPLLRVVDAQLPEKVHLVCIGGFVLAALYGFPRPTDDLDYLSIYPKQASELIERIAGKNSALSQRYKVFIDSAGGIVDLPEGYEDRLLCILLSYERLRITVPDSYDLVLSKLTRNSPKDRDDVKHVAIERRLRSRPSWDVSRPRWTGLRTLSDTAPPLTCGVSLDVGLMNSKNKNVGSPMMITIIMIVGKTKTTLQRMIVHDDERTEASAGIRLVLEG